MDRDRLRYLEDKMLDYSQVGVTKWDFRGGALIKLVAAANVTQAELVSRFSSLEMSSGWMSSANSLELYFSGQEHTCKIQQMTAANRTPDIEDSMNQKTCRNTFNHKAHAPGDKRADKSLCSLINSLAHLML
jgi:hypothetical protein